MSDTAPQIRQARCLYCNPWVRFIRTGSGAYARQVLHEPHCGTGPHLVRDETS